jgi:hypothetical protein
MARANTKTRRSRAKKGAEQGQVEVLSKHPEPPAPDGATPDLPAAPEPPRVTDELSPDELRAIAYGQVRQLRADKYAAELDIARLRALPKRLTDEGVLKAIAAQERNVDLLERGIKTTLREAKAIKG